MKGYKTSHKYVGIKLHTNMYISLFLDVPFTIQNNENLSIIIINIYYMPKKKTVN